MSEQILERPATAERSGATLPGLEEPVPGSSRKRTYLVVGLAIVAGLIIGMVVLFVMQSRAAQEAEAAAAATEASAAEAAEAAAAAAAAEAAQTVLAPTRTRVRITSRDPFAPLLPPPPPPPAPSAPRTAAPTDDGSTSAGSSSATGATISALSISASGNSVKLKLDGEPYTVDVGETFAKSYRLYSIFDDDCAGFLYGDQNAVVCEGGSVTLS